MFYVAEAMLLGKGLAFSKHSAVISSFGQEFAKKGIVPAELHRYLIEGQDSSNLGDYDIRSDLTLDDVSKHLSRAEQFLEYGERALDSQ